MAVGTPVAALFLLAAWRFLAAGLRPAPGAHAAVARRVIAIGGAVALFAIPADLRRRELLLAFLVLPRLLPA